VSQANERKYYGAGSGSQPQRPQLRFYIIKLDNPAFIVNRGASYSFKLTVPAGASNVKLQGHCVASGGSGNDVEVWVLTEDIFANCENRHSATLCIAAGG
jgi:hypothetical protein